jgi:hypothetical protein
LLAAAIVLPLLERLGLAIINPTLLLSRAGLALCGAVRRQGAGTTECGPRPLSLAPRWNAGTGKASWPPLHARSSGTAWGLPPES